MTCTLDYGATRTGSDKLSCPGCVGDDYLKSVVASAVGDDQRCSFCGAAPAAEFDVFMEAFMVGVRNEFEQADDAGMPWEGGYVFDHLASAPFFASATLFIIVATTSAAPR